MPPLVEIDFQRIDVKKLEEADDLSSFDCSQDDDMGLNEFIHEEALDFKRNRLGIFTSALGEEKHPTVLLYQRLL